MIAVPFLDSGGESDAFKLCSSWVEMRGGLVFALESWSRFLADVFVVVDVLGCADVVEDAAGTGCPAGSGTTASGSDDAFARMGLVIIPLLG